MPLALLLVSIVLLAYHGLVMRGDARGPRLPAEPVFAAAEPAVATAPVAPPAVEDTSSAPVDVPSTLADPTPPTE